MKRTVSLVSTTSAILRFFPDTSHNFNSEICSADFPIDIDKCQSKFGRWLAEKIPTTHFGDDLSKLIIESRYSEEDLHIREFAQSIQQTSLRSVADEERLFARMDAWIAQRRRVMSVYGESLYRMRTWNYAWPVFGSAAAGGSATPEEYFDKCGGAIRGLKPLKVYLPGLHGEEHVPEFFGVCRL